MVFSMKKELLKLLQTYLKKRTPKITPNLSKKVT